MTPSITFSPTLSASFDPARKLSRIMALLFTLGFWLTLAGMAVVPVLLAWPQGGRIQIGAVAASLDGLDLVPRIGAALALEISLAPLLLMLHHTKRVFGCFARGQVFDETTIGHIRFAGLWLVVLFFAEIVARMALIAIGALPPHQDILQFWPLFIGITTVIAAHVMGEAARIAAENAEIV